MLWHEGYSGYCLPGSIQSRKEPERHVVGIEKVISQSNGALNLVNESLPVFKERAGAPSFICSLVGSFVLRQNVSRTDTDRLMILIIVTCYDKSHKTYMPVVSELYHTISAASDIQYRSKDQLLSFHFKIQVTDYLKGHIISFLLLKSLLQKL